MRISREFALKRVESILGRIKLARQGHFLAWLSLNNYTRDSSETMPEPLELTQTHRDMIACLQADLLCPRCGRYHLSNPRSATIRCRRCGYKGPIGPRYHWINAPRGFGKTELAEKSFAFRIGLALYHGLTPRAFVIGGNVDEGVLRMARVKAVMRGSGNAACFGESVVPQDKQPARTLKVKGRPDTILAQAYGILSVPPGHHVDLILMDDIVDAKNTLIKPGLMYQVNDQYKNVVAKSCKPHTVQDYVGTPWRVGDVNSILREFAAEHPKQWRALKVACGGPDEDFSSPWPERFAPEDLRAEYDLDRRAYERGYMMRELDDSEIAFREIQFWTYRAKEKAKDAAHAQALMQCQTVAGSIRNKGWTIVVGVDPGFAWVMKQGRSRCGIAVEAWSPPDDSWAHGRGYLLYAHEDYMDPGTLKQEVLSLCRTYNTQYLGLENSAVALVDWFEERGITVFPYNPIDPAYGGSKGFRKLTLATDVNDGTVLMRGVARSSDGRPVIEPHADVARLHEAMRLFPAQCPDILDAAEIAHMTCKLHFAGEATLGGGSGAESAEKPQSRYQQFLQRQERARAEAELVPDDLEAAVARFAPMPEIGEVAEVFSGD